MSVKLLGPSPCRSLLRPLRRQLPAAVPPASVAQARPFLSFLTGSSSSASSSSSRGFTGGQGGPNDEVEYFEEKVMPYSPRQLYSVVADVPSYRHFIPFCAGSSVLPSSRSTPADIRAADPFEVDAELQVGFLGFRERYTSRVKGMPFESVEAVASSTPLFKTLVTTWTFRPPARTVDAAASGDLPPPEESRPTLVTLSIRYSFNSQAHAAASRLFLGRVSGLMVGAFEKRVRELYGPR